MASSTAELKNQLVDVFDRCLAMQADHLTGLKVDGLTKINQWVEERQTMVVGLQQALTDSHTSGLDPEFRTLLLEKLRCIMSTERVLFTLAKQQRSALAEQLSVIRRGKMTLGRYGSTIKNPPPQFVSDKG